MLLSNMIMVLKDTKDERVKLVNSSYINDVIGNITLGEHLYRGFIRLEEIKCDREQYTLTQDKDIIFLKINKEETLKFLETKARYIEILAKEFKENKSISALNILMEKLHYEFGRNIFVVTDKEDYRLYSELEFYSKFKNSDTTFEIIETFSYTY